MRSKDRVDLQFGKVGAHALTERERELRPAGAGKPVAMAYGYEMGHNDEAPVKIGCPLGAADLKALLPELQVDAAPDDTGRVSEHESRSPARRLDRGA